MNNSVKAQSFSSLQYAHDTVGNVETYLKDKVTKPISKAESALLSNYGPELDATEELNPVDAAYYQSLIGILRWMVELGRVDICVKVSMIPSQHLEQLFHIFAYLIKYHNHKMVFDPSVSGINMSKFERQDWSVIVYGAKLKEELPTNMIDEQGIRFYMIVYVDSNHDSDTVTNRLRTGFLIF